MGKEENSVIRRFVNLCHLFMKELGMPNMALQELLNRAHATTTTELESFKSVMHWDSLTAKVYDVGAEIAMGPYNPNFMKKKPQIPDLNQPPPQDDDEGPSEELAIMQVSDTFVTPVSDKIQIPDLNELPIPDLNKPPPQYEIQDRRKAVEDEATTTTSKRKITEANHSGIKRPKFTQYSVGPATGDKRKGVLKMEGWGEN